MVPCSCRSDLPIPCSVPDQDSGLQASAATEPIQHPSHEPSIGIVIFLTHKGERAEAILDGDGKWRCPVLPVLDRVLNALHGPRRDAGGDLPIGHAELLRVADWLKGQVEVRCS